MSQLTIQKGNNGFFTTLEQGATRKRTWTMGPLIFGPSTDGILNSFSLKYVDGATVFDDKLYTDIINGDTATAFASADALESYVQTNFFRKAGGAGVWGSISGTLSDQTDLAAALAAKMSALAPTAVKTGAYTLAVNDMVPVDTTGGNITLTLPTAPPNKSMVAIKMIGQAGTNQVTVAAGGSDVFNKTGGAVTIPLKLLNQGVWLIYSTILVGWYVLADDLSLAALDLRYAAIGGGGTVEPSGLVKSFKQDFAAVGNGIADDTTPVVNGLAGATRIFDNGDFLVTAFDNGKGVPLDGDLRILKATTNLNQQINTYADKYQRIFGQEYLAQFYAKVVAGSATKVILSGDSTTAGVGGTTAPDVLLAALTNKFHISGITYINRGHGGQATASWLSTYIAADLASTPDVYIIRWGINDSSTISTLQFLANLDSGLATIRANSNFTVDKLSIIIQSQNTTVDDNQNHKGQIFNEAVNNGLRGLARKYQCCFMDVYGLYQDSVGAKGVYLNTDGLHPLQVLYNMIMTATANILLPEFLRGGDVTDRGTSGIQNSAAGSAYPLGISYDFVQIPDGFPAKGMLVSDKMFNGTQYVIGQLLYPFNHSGHYSRQYLDNTPSNWVSHSVNRGSIGSTADAPATYPVGLSSQFVNSDFPIVGFLVTNRSDEAGGISVQILTSYDTGPTMYMRVSYLTTWQSWVLMSAPIKSNDVTAQTSTGTLITFQPLAVGTYRISAYINVTAVSVNTIQIQIQWTDENSVAQTISLTPIAAVGPSAYSPIVIRSRGFTNIVVKTNFAVSGGSATFDAGASLEKAY